MNTYFTIHCHIDKLTKRSQTYHAKFGLNQRRGSKGSRKSRKSQRSQRMSNPFLRPGSKLISSSTESEEGNIEYHIFETIKETKSKTTQLAINLNNSKNLIIKILEVSPSPTLPCPYSPVKIPIQTFATCKPCSQS